VNQDAKGLGAYVQERAGARGGGGCLVGSGKVKGWRGMKATLHAGSCSEGGAASLLGSNNGL